MLRGETQLPVMPTVAARLLGLEDKPDASLSELSEVISLDAGVRTDGLLALDLWDVVIEALRSNKDDIQPTHTIFRKLRAVQPKHTRHQETGAVFDSQTKTQTNKMKQKVDHV